ncbi:hypothetical protein COU16_01375 [Candidatus Kaiserbacteria bacterium CG10_big_fil_rev_8_21_14_0_10_47_16]|uniref:Dephospho-CoA kinase n=1 Tax=Candidatus Kaiserbacteria bacterium CG10_big_fil_rev_8_21_14_0_10_47_16 TaxID=1974608 RepID=A0A2H0UE47_9BACT|nr:MAG: hypothetical protein COU16_01375 [Candidatus Kaiserbacteria bacterium CG10_big_fil_rev_8_21_14_0_10_47_16]
MILGITGTDGAGKGTVVEYLVQEKGFTHYSARAIFIEEIERRGIENNRANMRLMGNYFREQYGNDFLIQYYLPKIKEAGVINAAIESIRAVAEAETLKENGGVLIAVDADQKLRYERVQKRRSTTDQVSFEQFQAHEELEKNDPDPHGMQKQKVIDMADYVVTNDGTLEELHAQVDSVLAEATHSIDRE